MIDTIVIELTALTQVLHGLDDNSQKLNPNATGANVSHNQAMVITGLMKRLIAQLPINKAG